VSETKKKESPADAPINMDWYIIKVAFNREDSIRDALTKRIKLSGLESYFGEIIIPTEDVVTFTRNGTRRVVKRKLYPGYLMAYMSVNDDTWFLVRETPGVGDFTGANGKPTPMDAHEVERIIKTVRPEEEGEKALKTAIPFRTGDRVRCKEGYFQNLEGEVEKVDEANGRVTVIISIFGRSTPVELDHWQIEAV
jgi:transcription termination/antitermination protein NusG